MQYFGGKQRIAKTLAAHMEADILDRGSYYEPFVGGANVIAQLHPGVWRSASDANQSLITMWQALATGWQPPTTVDEATYNHTNHVRDPFDPMTAFVGFGCSFAGKWFGGYARGTTHQNKERSYAASAARGLLKKVRHLEGVNWYCCSYTMAPISTGSVIYCDPPYAGTTQYGAVAPFDWTKFWEWCRNKQKIGCKVFVSEYHAPADFDCVLEIPTRTDIRTKTGRVARIEKLFTPRV